MTKFKMSDKMTPEQIKNFRTVLIGTLGPYAILMPDSEVEKMRDRFQEKIAEEERRIEEHDNEF